MMYIHPAAVMRNLILIRHAKSDWSNPSLSDFDRPLNARGEHDAPIMGDRLAEAGAQVERIISSPAKRARSTAERIARSLDFPIHDIDWISELYLASTAAIMDIIRNCPDDVTTLALVGHNPGISALTAELCGQGLGNVPTCGIVHLSSDFDSWANADNFELVNFYRPKRHP